MSKKGLNKPKASSRHPKRPKNHVNKGVIRPLQSTSPSKGEGKQDFDVPKPFSEIGETQLSRAETTTELPETESTSQKPQIESTRREKTRLKERRDARAKLRLIKSRRKEMEEGNSCEDEIDLDRVIPRRHVPPKVLVERVEKMGENALLSLGDIDYDNMCSQKKFRHMIEIIMEEMGEKYARMAIPYPECYFIQNIVEHMFSFRCSQGLYIARLLKREILRESDLYCFERLLARQANHDPFKQAIEFKLDHFGLEMAEKAEVDPELQVEKEMLLLEKRKAKWQRLREKRRREAEARRPQKKKAVNKRPDKREREERKTKEIS